MAQEGTTGIMTCKALADIDIDDLREERHGVLLSTTGKKKSPVLSSALRFKCFATGAALRPGFLRAAIRWRASSRFCSATAAALSRDAEVDAFDRIDVIQKMCDDGLGVYLRKMGSRKWIVKNAWFSFLKYASPTALRITSSSC